MSDNTMYCKRLASSTNLIKKYKKTNTITSWNVPKEMRPYRNTKKGKRGEKRRATTRQENQN